MAKTFDLRSALPLAPLSSAHTAFPVCCSHTASPSAETLRQPVRSRDWRDWRSRVGSPDLASPEIRQSRQSRQSWRDTRSRDLASPEIGISIGDLGRDPHLGTGEIGVASLEALADYLFGAEGLGLRA